jgi:3-oxoacyl-[acyl-carrier-protein] synthase-1
LRIAKAAPSPSGCGVLIWCASDDSPTDGAHRIGVIIGTSTSGLYETEDAYGVLVETGKMPDDFHFVTEHAYQATGRFVQLELGLTGVCFAISTACSSGAKAIRL